MAKGMVELQGCQTCYGTAPHAYGMYGIPLSMHQLDSTNHCWRQARSLQEAEQRESVQQNTCKEGAQQYCSLASPLPFHSPALKRREHPHPTSSRSRPFGTATKVLLIWSQVFLHYLDPQSLSAAAAVCLVVLYQRLS